MIHTNMPQSCTVFLLRREEKRSAKLWSQNFEPTKWQTMLVRDVKGNSRNFD